MTAKICLSRARRMSTKVIPDALLDIRDMPSPRGLPFIGTKLSLMAAGSDSGIHRYIDRRHKELGPIFRDSVGPVDAIFISDADMMRTVFTKLEGKYPAHILPDPWVIYNKKYNVKRGLFFMDGEEWLDMRRTLNKSLLKITTEAWIEPPIAMAVDDLVSKWKSESSRDGYVPDLNRDLYRLSLDVSLSVMLGSAYGKYSKRFDELLEMFSATVEEIFVLTSSMYLLPAKFYANLRLPVWKKFVDSCDKTLHYGNKLVEEIYNLDDIGDGLMIRLIQDGLNKDGITRVLTDLIMAAGDTTAYTSQWALYLLCKHPHTMASLDIRCVIKETMRLYPLATFITRILTESGELAGYRIPAGSIIIMSLYTSGRDPRYFTRPLEFLPERWDKQNNSEAVACSHASIPFGMGARSCIGRRVAMVQMKNTIEKIKENFDIRLVEDKPVEAVMQCVLKPKENIKIQVTPKL